MTVYDMSSSNDDAVASSKSSSIGASWVAGVRALFGKQAGLVVAFVAVIVYFWATQPIFMTWSNITNLVSTNSVVLVLAIGATFVVISGGLDLSTVSATTLAGMAFGFSLTHQQPFVVSLIVVLGTGMALGLVNGILIAWVRMSFLVVTLGTMTVFSSLALVSNGGATLSVFSEPGFAPLKAFVTGEVGPIPYIMIFDVVLALVAGGVLRYTAYGRSLFAVGSNAEAARINGINVTVVTLMTFILAGLSAGVGALLQVGRLTGASATTDPTLLMAVLAAVLLGGTAATGGEGGIFGSVLGVLFLGVLTNGLTISQVSAFWQGTVNGGVLLLAVLISTGRDRGWFTRRPRSLTTFDQTVVDPVAASTSR
ncbi:ABC transporter permease [Nocardioides sp. BP30]|uniref:ABC transporter permease n=1 Tax=Nocardioides sp. BP30 TaxID=3036374 RepID=UPI0024684E42|nr:ABC transporter permease [Nocardioides sp. BP30]WGL50787.1 ABC transporter permease [Nocardioides sp. BP30]